MINRIFAILAFLLFCAITAPAQGATAISYSEVDNTYGWCAGYTTSEAPGCAKQWCEQSNGTDCRLALVCDAGWNAVAFADSDEATGFGAACDMSSAYMARTAALAICIVKSRTVCWTNSTFDGGGDERSDSDNGEFDLTWYIQGLLLRLGYDPGSSDGAFGNKTRTAIRAFQADMGIDQTGEISEDLFYMLLTKNGGTPFLVSDMESLVSELSSDEVSRTFSAAHAPNPGMTLSDELGIRNTAVQRIMFADYLRINDLDCPIPASTAERTDPANGVWTVTCRNGGDYTITLSADGQSDRILDNNEEPPPTEVAETDDPNAPAETGELGIAFSHSAPDDGWSVCTGTVADAAACAQDNCTNVHGGAACETVLTCDDRGWSAAATSPDDLRGMGFTCGYSTSHGARSIALVECLYRTHAICRIAGTVDPEGNPQPAEDDDRFTLIYNTQAMLSILGYFPHDLDGVLDQRTTDAAVAFQTEIGVEPTGTVDEDLFQLAYYAQRGVERFDMILTRDIYDKIDPVQAPNHYGASDRPAVPVSFSEELAGLGEDERLRAFAVAISYLDGAHCTIPALEATAENNDPATGRWAVQCTEGSASVVFEDFGIAVNEPPPESTPAPTPSPGPGPSKDKPTKTKG